MNAPIIIKRGAKINPAREAARQKRLRASLERSAKRRLRILFTRIAVDAATEYERAERVTATLDGAHSRIEAVMVPLYRSVINAFAEAALTHLAKDSEHEALVRTWLDENGGAKIVGVTLTTQEDIMSTIKANADQGKMVVGRAIRQKLAQGGYPLRRAVTIARTETHAAANWASQVMHEKLHSDSTVFKQWVSTNDGRVRKAHSYMNGVKVEIDKPFIVTDKSGSHKMMYPGDYAGPAGQIINCRCICIYIEKDGSPPLGTIGPQTPPKDPRPLKPRKPLKPGTPKPPKPKPTPAPKPTDPEITQPEEVNCRIR